MREHEPRPIKETIERRTFAQPTELLGYLKAEKINNYHDADFYRIDDGDCYSIDSAIHRAEELDECRDYGPVLLELVTWEKVTDFGHLPVDQWPKSTDRTRWPGSERQTAAADPLGIFDEYGIAHEGESLTEPDPDGWTPLHFAARNCVDRWQFKRFIAEHGGVDAKDFDDGFTPLHVAADNGNSIAIEALIEAGADVNAKDKDGWTPLHLACHFANRKSVVPINRLIEAGADVDARKTDGERPEDVARRCSNHAAMLAIEAARIHEDRGRDGWVDVVRKHRGHQGPAGDDVRRSH